MLVLLNYLALTIPGIDGKPEQVAVPGNIPSGGLAKGEDGATALQWGISAFLLVITVLSLFFLIFGGIKWITSSGDKSKIDNARKTIIYAIVGLMLAFFSFFIISLLGNLFGVTLLVLN